MPLLLHYVPTSHYRQGKVDYHFKGISDYLKDVKGKFSGVDVVFLRFFIILM